MKRISQNLDDAIIVALGSSLPGRFESSQDLLDAAIGKLGGLGMVVRAQSAWWRSKAWPNPSDPAFINGVAIVETGLTPLEVMAALHGLEAAFGRERHVVNAPRPLDLDLVAYGRIVSDRPMLPHPRAHERSFVMGPLAEIAPGWIHPTSGLTSAALSRDATVGADAAPLRP